MDIYEKELDNVHLFYADVSGLDTDKKYPYVSQYRRDKISRLKRDTDKKLSLGAELLLIHALQKYYPDISIPFEIKVGVRGKPQIDGVHFSLAHTGTVAVCAVADTLVGVDIEKASRTNSGVAKKYFNENEQKYEFSYIWTRKEAAVKADGGGIALGLETIDVTNDTVVVSGTSYRLISIKPEITGYDIALCVK